MSILYELIYELSLSTSRPFTSDFHRHISRATAAMEALSSYIVHMKPAELKLLECTVAPLVFLLGMANKTSFYSIEPVAVTAAGTLCKMMPSRKCMSAFIQEKGLETIVDIFEDVFSKPLDLTAVNLARSLVENCAVLYREIARHYPWEVVNSGGVRFCVQMLRVGDVPIKTISAAILAVLSTNLEICKVLFSYGAIKPLLLACDSKLTNEACTLSGIGCITQMCRIPEITIIMVKQGALPVLVSSLALRGTYSNDAIHEKALFGLSCIAKIDQLKPLLGTSDVLALLRAELELGTAAAKYTVVHMLLDVHTRYADEDAFLRSIVDHVIDIMRTGSWHAKNLCVKAICVLYKSDAQLKLYLVERGDMIRLIFTAMAHRSVELQEAFLVGLLTLCTHPDIPRKFIEVGGIHILAPMVGCSNVVVSDLAVVLLKGIALYDRRAVEEAVDSDFLYLFANFVSDEYKEDDHVHTTGGMIDEFLTAMVENRRDQHYLLEMFPAYTAVMEANHITADELESYEHTFYELDPECRGVLGLTELKMLGVMLGEKFDKEELEELLVRHDTDQSGSLDFLEFIVMMQSWFSANKQENITKQLAHDTIERGPIANARRAFMRFWRRDEEDQKNIADIKAKKEQKKAEARELAKVFLTDKKLLMERLKDISRQDSVSSSSLASSSRETIKELVNAKRNDKISMPTQQQRPP